MPPTSPLEEPSYGSDKDGLVWAYLFTSEIAGRSIDTKGAADWLATSTSEKKDGFLWLHFNLSNSACVRWLRQHVELPDAFYESLDEAASSTRLEREDDALVAVLHDVLFDFEFDASDVATVSLVAAPHLLVSARGRPLRSIDRLRASVKAGSVFRSPAELFGQLLRDQAEVLVEIARKSSERVDREEDLVLSRGRPSSRTELGSLRRMLVRLQRLLAPEPAALFRLLSRPPRWLTEDDVRDLRQAAEEFSAAVSDSVALGERIRLVQEEIAALTNEKTSKSLFVLTLVTTAALPFNVVGALFGMNVGGIPLAEHPHGFWSIVAFVAVFTGAVGYAFARRR